MSWVNDIVRVRPDPPADDGVRDSLELYRVSGSYDEYVLLCACTGVEPLFTREEFEIRDAFGQGIIPI